MSHTDALRIVAADAGAQTLTKDQKRFNTLLGQIAKARATLDAWRDGVAQYGSSHVDVLLPLAQQRDATRRQWALALDALSRQRGWTRTERSTMRDLLCDAAGGLLQQNADDEALKAVFARHAKIDYEENQRRILDALKNVTETMTGLDLGDAADITSQDDLLQRMQSGLLRQQEEQNAEAEAEREAGTPPRRQSAAQQRREAQAQRATQSVREIWRKLAATLHPDRETDPTQRAAKTALMQELNQAYDKGDLLALLELQLRIEQVDAGHMARADAQQVKHYNQVLSEQLSELRLEIERVEIGFCMDFGISPESTLTPQKLGLLLKRQVQELEADLACMQKEFALFEDRAATQRWLHTRRLAMLEDDGDLDFF